MTDVYYEYEISLYRCESLELFKSFRKFILFWTRSIWDLLEILIYIINDPFRLPFDLVFIFNTEWEY